MDGYKVLKGQVRCDGVRYETDQIINAKLLAPSDCEKLISQNIISPVVYDSAEVIDVVENTPTNEGEPTEKTLDLNFSLDELREGAKALELTFKGNISKAALIQIIVNADKQGYFLDQLEDEGDGDGADEII